MKALVGAFNQEKTLIGAFSVIVKTDGSSAALNKIVITDSPHRWKRDTMNSASNFTLEMGLDEGEPV